MTVTLGTVAIAYGAALIMFLAADYVWLTRVAAPMYRAHVGHLLRPKPKMGAAVLFYAAYVAGIVYLAILPAMGDDAVAALAYGGALGFLAYGTYDATNYATLRDWPLSVALMDIAWGMFVTAIAALAGYFAALALG